MLAYDSLVLDLIFQQNAAIKPDVLLEALGGQEGVAQRKMLDPDMHGPQFEMELSPTMPFRQRGERRLMLIDDAVAPMRESPREDPLVPVDLRPEKERLITVCESLPIRLGRLFALGSWGDAVLVARSARDLRAICLLSWALDPSVDVDGKRIAGQLSQSEFETKLMAFEKRLDELDEEDILANLHTGRLERRGELLIVDVLEDDGTWDLRKSMALEAELAAIEQFSLLPGAPAAGKARRGAAEAPAAKAPEGAGKAVAEAAPAPAPEPEPAGPPLRVAELGGRVVLVFPPERFDLDVAATLGKGDYEGVMRKSDEISGPVRDRIFRDGADFVAPLEFLSEVFVDGKPLSRPQFEQGAREVAAGARAMDVHCPRFGPVVLLDIAGQGRFISSAMGDPSGVAALIGG